MLEGPGPEDPSVLYAQENHCSKDLDLNPNLSRRIRFVQHSTKWKKWKNAFEHPGIVERLRQAGFLCAMQLPSIELDHALLTALVERWRPETQTFHMRYGELTITLRDVALLTGLIVDGSPIIASEHPIAVDFERLMGCVVPTSEKHFKCGKLSLDWLRETYSTIPEGASDEVLDHHARAYILYYVGCYLMPDSSQDFVDLRNLQFMKDFHRTREISWGAAALANLYRQLSAVSLKSQSRAYGFFSLLQAWSWYHFMPGCPESSPVLNDQPLMSKFRGHLVFTNNAASSDPSFYRNEFDVISESQITWNPYSNDLMSIVPQQCLEGDAVWMARHIPAAAPKISRDRLRGGQDWTERHASHLAMWEERYMHVVEEDPTIGEDHYSYMDWFWKITRRWISVRTSCPITTYQSRDCIERRLVGTINTMVDTLKNVVQKMNSEDTGYNDITTLLDYVQQQMQPPPLNNYFSLFESSQHDDM